MKFLYDLINVTQNKTQKMAWYITNYSTYFEELCPVSVSIKRWLSYDYSTVAFLWSKYNTCAREK